MNPATDKDEDKTARASEQVALSPHDADQNQETTDLNAAKPFALIELLARIEALVRRGQPRSHSEIILKANGLTVDLLARTVTRDGEEVTLQAREFKLLEFLLRHKNQIVTRNMLLEHVWHYHFDPQTNVIDVHISRLRQKIDVDPSHSRIKTVRGEGYIIEDTEQKAA
jgi:two-component system, OmpR family, response regulator